MKGEKRKTKLIRIPEELHKKLKVEAAEKGITLLKLLKEKLN